MSNNKDNEGEHTPTPVADIEEATLDARHRFIADLFELHLYNSVRRALA